MLVGTDLRAGREIIERMRVALSAAALAHAGDEPVFATASFGVILLDPDVTIEASMDRADKALYAAKAAGRNCVRLGEAAGVPPSPGGPNRESD